MTTCSISNTGPHQPDEATERAPERVPAATEEPAATTATSTATSTATKPAPVRPKPESLPLWRVLLHNDDHNDMDHVVESIVRVARLNRPSATRCMMEAHRKGLGQVVTTHRERAEFLAEQLRSLRLVVTIEPVR